MTQMRYDNAVDLGFEFKEIDFKEGENYCPMSPVATWHPSDIPFRTHEIETIDPHTGIAICCFCGEEFQVERLKG